MHIIGLAIAVAAGVFAALWLFIRNEERRIAKQERRAWALAHPKPVVDTGDKPIYVVCGVMAAIGVVALLALAINPDPGHQFHVPTATTSPPLGHNPDFNTRIGAERAKSEAAAEETAHQQACAKPPVDEDDAFWRSLGASPCPQSNPSHPKAAVVRP